MLDGGAWIERRDNDDSGEPQAGTRRSAVLPSERRTLPWRWHRLQAGFGFGAPGLKPGRFYDFAKVSQRTPNPAAVDARNVS